MRRLLKHNSLKSEGDLAVSCQVEDGAFLNDLTLSKNHGSVYLINGLPILKIRPSKAHKNKSGIKFISIYTVSW